VRRGAILSLLALGACVQAPVRQGGIVSTNPCADAILVRLAPPERIAAISHYSHDPDATSLPLAVARRFAVTAGTAEEVIARRPDLVLADSFAPAATLAAYRRAGLRVVVLDSPTTVAASVAQVRRVAAAVGEPARGEQLADEIARAASPVAAPGPRALFYISGDLANGSGNLLDEMMRIAGLRNAAADYGLSFSGTVPVETLVGHPPEVVIATGEGRSAALRRRLLPGVRQVTFPRTLLNCGGPSIPAALVRLRAVRAGA
jgi:iron complex transport system substrate-binding protein